MAEPVRILHVLGKLNMGGAESRVMDLYRHIDREKVQFDFVIHTTDHCYFTDEIVSLGGRIFSVPRFRIYNLSAYKNAWKKLLNEHRNADGSSEFKMIQGHMTSTAAIYLPIAKECGVKTTIAHARSAGVDAGIKGKLTRFLRRNLANRADLLFTCSNIAGISVFGREAVNAGRTKFIPNAIAVSKFKYDENTRKSLKQELSIEDRLVIGHVGRFHYAKNHEYLLSIFRDMIEDYEEYEIDKRPVLILLGDGPKMAEMKALADEYNILEDVRFLGNKSNVYDYYQVMDYFVYPSRYEGLPGTVVEAQAAGVPVLMSDLICDEVQITDLVKVKSITSSSDDWAREVLNDIKMGLVDENIRGMYNDKVSNAGFDITKQAKDMQEFYTK